MGLDIHTVPPASESSSIAVFGPGKPDQGAHIECGTAYLDSALLLANDWLEALETDDSRRVGVVAFAAFLRDWKKTAPPQMMPIAFQWIFDPCNVTTARHCIPCFSCYARRNSLRIAGCSKATAVASRRRGVGPPMSNPFASAPV